MKLGKQKLNRILRAKIGSNLRSAYEHQQVGIPRLYDRGVWQTIAVNESQLVKTNLDSFTEQYIAKIHAT